MKSIMNMTMAIAGIFSLSACATIIEGSTDRVAIASPQHSTCSLKNGLGSWSITPPGSAEIKKSKTDLDVVCRDLATGIQGSKIVESDMEPWFLGNIVIGGIIGGVIDASTGSMWEYPKEISVTMPTPAPAGVPAVTPENGFNFTPAPAAPEVK